MRQNDCSVKAIRDRYHIGSGTAQLNATGFSLEQLKALEPFEVDMIFYPPENFQRKDILLLDFQQHYDSIHAKHSKVNVAYWWFEYEQDYSDGYE